MKIRLNLIAAACENMGIGLNGRLPWKLKGELDYFARMTTNTIDSSKRNVVIMGRRTWECLPRKHRPLANRINIVLTSQLLDVGDDAIVCKSIPAALEFISQQSIREKVEAVWIIGGRMVYKEAMESPHFHRLYLTKINKYYECDTFFPDIPNDFVVINAEDIPKGIQTENNIEYEYKVYGKEKIINTVY